jgi:hypothetical protein
MIDIMDEWGLAARKACKKCCELGNKAEESHNPFKWVFYSFGSLYYELSANSNAKKCEGLYDCHDNICARCDYKSQRIAELLKEEGSAVPTSSQVPQSL